MRSGHSFAHADLLNSEVSDVTSPEPTNLVSDTRSLTNFELLTVKEGHDVFLDEKGEIT